jgi:hypothetical protein
MILSLMTAICSRTESMAAQNAWSSQTNLLARENPESAQTVVRLLGQADLARNGRWLDEALVLSDN